MPRPQSVSNLQILDAARSYFIQHGHTASVKGVARVLGVSHAAIFQRFGSKKNLMIQALAPPTHFDWPARIKEGPHLGSEKQDLFDLCEVIHTFFIQRTPCIRVIQAAGILLEEVFAQGRPVPLVAIQETKEWIDVGIKNGVFMPCDSHAVAILIVGSLFSRVQMSRLVEVRCDLDISSSLHPALGSLDGLVDFLIKGLCSP